MRIVTFGISWDAVGTTFSLLCLVHCLLLPWLALLLPVAWLLDESVHLWLLFLLVPSAAVAALRGLILHGRFTPAALLGAGSTLVSLACLEAASEFTEVALTVAGSLLLITGHLVNSRWIRIHRMVVAS